MSEWIVAVLMRLDLSVEDAETAARVVTRTSLRGIDTHRVALLPLYFGLLRRGDARARPNVVSERRGSVHVVDADCGLGQVVGTTVLGRLADEARRTGLAVASVRDVGHLGALGHYVLEAAESGLVALVMQNSQPLMALPGATGRSIGNNPLAFGSPIPGRNPLVFDMAASEAALGKIMNLGRSGQTVPSGWALDRDGRPTIDAAEALAGMLLPMAGAKGIGLAMMVEILAGSLSGTSPAARQRPNQIPHAFGAFMAVLDPRIAAGANAFDRHVSAWMDHYLAHAADGRYPGARAAETERIRARSGIPIDGPLLTSLEAEGAKSGRPWPASH